MCLAEWLALTNPFQSLGGCCFQSLKTQKGPVTMCVNHVRGC